MSNNTLEYSSCGASGYMAQKATNVITRSDTGQWQQLQLNEHCTMHAKYVISYTVCLQHHRDQCNSSIAN